MQVPYQIVAATVVGLGIYTPQMMPDLMGSASEAYTVRRLWGVFWHQLPRRVRETCAVHAKGTSHVAWLTAHHRW
jgi:hypothetical protein